ncbi:amidohydrolase family protein [Pigmentiphaga soli]|uniref:Amidohydrolase family protein n=1 Tax=Pigmentiphaga soli TaxID=1007095 RepID=A0ABP8HQ37_9BURK
MSSPHRIDVHFHTVPPAFVEAIRRDGINARTPEWSPDLALSMMDRHGIAAAVTSLSVPGTHFGDDAKARVLTRQCNDYYAQCVAGHPDRFGAFGSTSLPDVEAACADVAYALDTLKLDGMGLLTNYAGKYLGHPDFDPVLQELDRREAVVLIHPTFPPYGQAVSIGVPPFLVEYLFETTRAATSLVFSGALDRFPRIRFILSHAGGTLPYAAWRIADIAWRQLAQEEHAAKYPLPLIEQERERMSLDTVLSRLRRFWYDTALSPGAQTLGALQAVADPSRILFGSDWPYAPETMTADSIASLSAAGLLTEAQRADVERNNALQLFPRLARALRL